MPFHTANLTLFILMGKDIDKIIPHSIKNNRIIIMGASSGIGRNVARCFASAGWFVGIAARNIEALQSLKDEFSENIIIHKIDINSDEAADSLLHLINLLGGMDIYFHSSGIYRDKLDLNERDELDVAQTNVIGFTRMISAAYRWLRDNNPQGRIAAISSVAATRGLGRLAAYSASKMYDRAYLEALGQLSVINSTKITIVDIRPGWTRTPLLDSNKHYLFESDTDKILPDILKAILHKRGKVVIGPIWKIITYVENLIPATIWRRFPVSLWREIQS